LSFKSLTILLAERLIAKNNPTITSANIMINVAVNDNQAFLKKFMMLVLIILLVLNKNIIF